MRLPRKAPSPATAIAALALLIALGGTSVAAVSQVPRNSVGAAQLKANAVTNPKLASNSVTSAEVRNRSLRRVDFQPGQLPAGPTGPQGAPGAAGAPGVSAREQVTAESPLTATGPKNLTVTCPAGKKVIGGGVELGGAGRNRVTATENKPSGDNAWEAEAFEVVNTTATWKVIVHAICANVAP
jgi:hypothetical protein